MVQLRFWCSCLVSTFAVLPLVASAEGLSLAQAIERTLQSNPDLTVFAYELRAQEGRVLEANARPPIEAGATIENALGSGARSGLDAAETTLSLAFLFERGALERRRAVAAAGASLLDSELKLRRVDAAAEASRRFMLVLDYQQQVSEFARARELAEQSLAAVQLRVRAARVPQAEEARARAALARVKLDEQRIAHELRTAQRRLVALWGELEPSFTNVIGELSKLPALPPFEALRAELDNNPDFERFVSEQRLRETELRLAEAKQRPPWQLTTGVRRFEEGDDVALVVGVTVPLPARDATRGAVAQARAYVDAVDAKRSARRVQLDTELFALYQQLTHAYAEAAMLRDDVLPKMEQAAAESRYAYERGRYSYMEWVAAQRELLDLRRALSSAYARVHRERIEIERLIGASLVPKTAP
jgi:outer membrane protein, heavy metal efflux system